MYQSQYLAVAAAYDLILWCTNKYPQHLQLMIRDQLEMQSCSSLFKDLRPALRVCYSKDYSDKTQCEAVVKRSSALRFPDLRNITRIFGTLGSGFLL